jgi:hypothetical protein
LVDLRRSRLSSSRGQVWLVTRQSATTTAIRRRITSEPLTGLEYGVRSGQQIVPQWRPDEMALTIPQIRGVIVSTRLEETDAARVRDIAAANDRSVSAEIRRAVRAYLNDEGSAGKRTPSHDSGAGIARRDEL